MTISKEAVEAKARAIYEAWGYVYEGRLISPRGPYGEWAKAVDAAERVLALRPAPSQSDRDRAHDLIALLENQRQISGVNRSVVVPTLCSSFAAVRAEATLAEREKVWREAARHCLDVSKAHLPDYFNSIADEAARARK